MPTIFRASRRARAHPAPFERPAVVSRRRRLNDEITDLLAARGTQRLAPTPLLNRAVQIIARRLPASSPEIHRRLVAARLVREQEPVDLAQIERAARFCTIPVRFSILRRDGFAVAVLPAQLPAATTVYGLAIRAVVNWGLALMSRITFQADVANPGFAKAILSARPNFDWLDKGRGWFWFRSERNPLVRAIEKVLHVAGGPVALDDLFASLFRRWTPDNVPSRRALHAICQQASRLRVNAGMVDLAAGKAPEPDDTAHPAGLASNPLSASEQAVVMLFRHYGPRVEGHRLPELGAALGISAGPLGRVLRASPFVLETHPGIFRLVGS
jgi:hypothetical protein